MKRNVGLLDRIIRILIAGVLIYLFMANMATGAYGIVALVVAAVMLLTSVFGSCPLYSITGICTTPKIKNR